MLLANPSHLILETFSDKGSKAGAADLSIDYGFVSTPLGSCLIGETGGRICYMAFAPEGTDSEILTDLSRRWPGAFLSDNPQQVGRRAGQIFAGSGPDGGVIQLLVRGTQFQVEVWQALLRIPAGSVQTYAQVAQEVGRPKAMRAVGTAIGANPIAWLIPCHRVIRSDGQLGGYRWGTATKKACLAYEKERSSSLE